MLITATELKTVAPNEVVQAITDGDNHISEEIIKEAEQTIRAYLHHRYDTAAIFAATGPDRHPLVVRLLKEIAIYQIYIRRSRDGINEAIAHRYEYAMKQLKEIAAGVIHPEGLPQAQSQQQSSVFFHGGKPHDTNF